ncbi:MAG: hypothetical protein E7480_08595 [Ruminococcaceae bacterium]|nr:hypothetical protein [Oscillospiraceae bacterium]
MKKENIEIGGCYFLNGNIRMITNISNGNIYASDVEFDENGIPYATGCENLLTDYEVKHLQD